MTTQPNYNNGNKTILIALFLIAVFYFLISCDVVKDQHKEKANTDSHEQVETKTKRKGDSISLDVLKYNVVWKDTVIVRTTTQGTILRTFINKDGKIYKVTANCSEIDEFRKEIKDLKSDLITKDKHKTEGINPNFIYAGFGALIVIFAIAFFAMYKLIDKKTAILNIKQI